MRECLAVFIRSLFLKIWATFASGNLQAGVANIDFIRRAYVCGVTPRAIDP